MKKVFSKATSVLLALAMLIGVITFSPNSLQASSEEVIPNASITSEKYQYIILEDNTIEITKYIGTDDNVVIPDTIDGYYVTSIGEKAFYNNENIKSISITEKATKIGSHAFGNISISSLVIPDNVKEIGAYAFANCKALKSIIIGKGLKNISSHLFGGCSALQTINIPDNIKSISWYAFQCDSLTDIHIGSGVEEIDSLAFPFCSSLKDIHVSENNAKYCSINGVLFNKAGTVLVRYPAGRVGHYTVPENVNTIYDNAFHACKKLNGITLSDNVQTICRGAFDYTALHDDETNWENGVLYIDNHIIDAKDTLSGIYNIKEGTVSIGEGALGGTQITGVVFPKSLKSINWHSFSHCEKLETIFMENTDCKIRSSQAFESSQNIKTIYYHGTRSEWNLWLTNNRFYPFNSKGVTIIFTAVENISFDKTAIAIDPGDSENLITNITPDTAINKNIMWASSDPAVVTVQNGIIKGVKSGTSIITAITEEGGYMAQCLVTVNGPTSIQIIVMPQKLNYTKDYESFDPTGGKLKLTYNNGTSEEIDLTANMVSGFDNTKLGKQILTVTYEGFTDTFEIEIIDFLPGDVDGDGTVNDKDVEYLMYHILYPDQYPVRQNCDFNGDGSVTDKDAEYLLYHIIFPESYPLYN